MITITRRIFLGLCVLAPISTAMGKARPPSKSEQLVAAVIRRDLDYVIADEDDIRRFAQDYIKRERGGRWLEGSQQDRLLNYVRSGKQDQMLATKEVRIFESIARGVTTNFLLSTDFFYKPITNPSRVSYRNYRSAPAALNCGNPFARFD